MKKDIIGKIIKVRCKDLDISGRGICESNSRIIVVDYLLPQEEAIVLILYRNGSRWFGEIKELIKVSENRRIPPCSISNECGGCTLQHIDDGFQLKFKVKYLIDVLERIGRLNPIINTPISNRKKHFKYRNRAIIPLKRINSREINFGFYKKSTHDIIPMSNCNVLHPMINSIIPILKRELSISKLNADSDIKINDCIRHIVIRISDYTEELLITIVSGIPQPIAELNKIALKFSSQIPYLVGLVENIQPEPNNLIFGDRNKIYFGRDYIKDKFLGLEMRIKNHNFYQINKPLAELIVKQICNWFLEEELPLAIVDAYCGIGTISLPLAVLGFKVIGLELNNESIVQAKINKELNNLQNAQFIAGDVLENLENVLNEDTCLIIDPPRKGLNTKIIDIISKKTPPRIAYLSCNPATLARDLRLICSNNFYKIEYIQPIDFFPQTTHLESLALLKLTNF